MTEVFVIGEDAHAAMAMAMRLRSGGVSCDWNWADRSMNGQRRNGRKYLLTLTLGKPLVLDTQCREGRMTLEDDDTLLFGCIEYALNRACLACPGPCGRPPQAP